MADHSERENKTPERDEGQKSSGGKVKEACPYLGIQFDPKSHYTFPSELHRCFHTQPVGSPMETHQARACLTSSHDKCPVFNQAEGQKMPPELNREQSTLWHSKKLVFSLAGLLAVFLLIIVISSVFRKGNSAKEAQSEIPTWTSVVNQAGQESATALALIGTLDEMANTPTPTLNQPTKTATPAPSPTITFTPTITLTPTSTHGLDVVIGETYKFVIHRTGDGESVQMYADLYNTTPQAIYDSNYLMPVPIWINWLIIIPVDIQDTSALPAFEAYMVEKDAVRLDLLADELDVKLRDLMLYNNLEVDHLLNYGDWLLIPRERPDFTN